MCGDIWCVIVKATKFYAGVSLDSLFCVKIDLIVTNSNLLFSR